MVVDWKSILANMKNALRHLALAFLSIFAAGQAKAVSCLPAYMFLDDPRGEEFREAQEVLGWIGLPDNEKSFLFKGHLLAVYPKPHFHELIQELIVEGWANAI